jgi:hypothetical protein
MNTFKIGNNTLIKDTNEIGLIESGLARITYPLSFTTAYFNIEQDYYCESNNVPSFVQGTAHSLYPNSKAVSQSSTKLASTGLATFTRKFVQFPSGYIEQPSTATVTYPSIAIGANYQARGIQTVKQSYQIPTNLVDEDGNIVMSTQYRDVPAVTDWYRKNSVTKVIPVIQEISFIYMGSTLESVEFSARSVSVGTRINGKIVSSIEFNSETERYTYTFEDGSQTSVASDESVTVQVPTYNPSSILVNEPFKIIDGYSGHVGAEVEFIDDYTTPNRSSFLSSTNQDRLLFASQVNHVEGHLYMKKNIFGKIQ